MILWEGSCIVHEAFSFERIVNLSKTYPKAKFIAHPESESQILEIADYIGSTSGLLKFVQENSATEVHLQPPKQEFFMKWKNAALIKHSFLTQ